MAAGYDGSIRIDTNINTKGFNTGSNQIGKGLSGITSSLKKMAVATGIAFGVAAIINFGKASVKASTDLTNAMTGLKSVMDGQGRSFNQAQKFINDYVSDGLIPATQAITAYKNLALRGYDDSQIKQVMVALKDSAAYGRQSSLSMGEAVQSATEGLKNENSILVDNAGVTKNVAKMWEDYAKSIGTTSNSLTKQQKIQAEVLGIMEETRFQTGDAANIADSYSGQVLKLGYNFNNLKIAVGNALIPMAQAILPSINAIIAALTRLANVFAQVTTAIFGKQAKQQEQIAKSGTNAAKAQSNLASATKKAGKEAKGAVAGFDELNVLTKETASSADGATDGLGEDIAVGEIAAGGEIGSGVTVSSDVENAINNIKGYLMQIQSYVDEYLKAPFNAAIDMITPKIEEFKTILSGVWADVGNLGQPLKDWFMNDFTPFLQTSIQSLGTIISGLFDTFNMVFADIWNIVVYPTLEKTITVWLPVITAFTTKANEAFMVLFEEVKNIFDMLWQEGVKPALVILMGIWNDMVDSFAEAWNTYGEPIFEGIKEVFRGVGEVLKTVWETTLKPVWDTFMQTVDWLWTNHLKPLLDNFLALVGEFIVAALRIINEFILPIVNSFVETFGPTIANVFQTVISILGTFLATAADVISGVITVIRGIIEFLAGAFTGDWKKAWNGLVKIFKGIFEGIGGIIKGVVNTAIDMINSMIRAITNGLNFVIGAMNKLSWDVPDWVPGIGGKKWGFDIQTLTAPIIPKLATGAVIPPNSEFLAILGDQKSGRNIETPESLLRQIVREELGGMMQGGDITIENIMNLDGDVVYRDVKKIAWEQFKRTGESPFPA